MHNLKAVLAWVDGGEEVRVVRRGKVVARLLPPEPTATAAPDFAGRARAIRGSRPTGKLLSRVVADGRGDR